SRDWSTDVCSSDLDFTQKSFAGLCVEDAFFFKTGEGIGGQDFGPFVTVVTSSVTTGKYVTEAVLKTIECRRRHNRNFAAHLIEDGLRALWFGRIVFRMETEVEQCELQLPYQLHPRLETFGLEHLVHQR